jgi:hypothetical protein
MPVGFGLGSLSGLSWKDASYYLSFRTGHQSRRHLTLAARGGSRFADRETLRSVSGGVLLTLRAHPGPKINTNTAATKATQSIREKHLTRQRPVAKLVPDGPPSNPTEPIKGSVVRVASLERIGATCGSSSLVTKPCATTRDLPAKRVPINTFIGVQCLNRCVPGRGLPAAHLLRRSCPHGTRLRIADRSFASWRKPRSRLA